MTTDVARRFEEHRRKRARYTSYNPPIRVVYRERFRTRSAALTREAHIKRQTRAQKLALIAGARVVSVRSDARASED